MLQSIRRSYEKAAVGSLIALSSAVALADDPFTAAMADATTKVGTYAAALVGLSAVGVGFMIAVKYVKKIKGAA